MIEHSRLTNKLSLKFKVNFATSCNSATSALHLACLALGVKKGDYVVVTAGAPIGVSGSTNNLRIAKIN